MKPLHFTLLRWLPFALIITIMSGLVYLSVQQNYRQSANDPQIELAREGAVMLQSGQPPQIFGSDASLDVKHTLIPFIIIYDESGKVLSGTASLDGKIPVPPKGVFEHAKAKGENRLTWQPAPGVRIATVVVYFKGKQSGFILSGRSLEEVEHRESMLMLYVFSAWIAALASTFAVVAFDPANRNRDRQYDM